MTSQNMTRNEEPSISATNIRLSRISYPRANIWVLLSLVIVLLGFGLWAEAAMPDRSDGAGSHSGITSMTHTLEGTWANKVWSLF